MKFTEHHALLAFVAFVAYAIGKRHAPAAVAADVTPATAAEWWEFPGMWSNV
jgi:urease accessory protein UreE